jgi:hypothetical protein
MQSLAYSFFTQSARTNTGGLTYPSSSFPECPEHRQVHDVQQVQQFKSSRCHPCHLKAVGPNSKNAQVSDLAPPYDGTLSAKLGGAKTTRGENSASLDGTYR